MTSARALILLYHRVGAAGADPWALTVGAAHFRQHLEMLRRECACVRLGELPRTLARASRRERFAVVTLDDGYRGTIAVARPLLRDAAVPATCFLVAGALAGNGPFWWDELSALLLEPGVLPPVLDLDIGGARLQRTLDQAVSYDEAAFARLGQWRGWEPAPGPRQSLYRAAYDLLRPLPEAARRLSLERLRAWAGRRRVMPASDAADRSLSTSEVSVLAADSLIDIGAHTVTHPVLAGLSRADQAHEITTSRTMLEHVTGKPVTSFAYPYGGRDAYTDETVVLVRRAGFASACVNAPGVTVRSSDPYRLPRVLIPDEDGAAFAARLRQLFAGLEGP